MTYHERQWLMQCAQHAINNLLQEPAVTSSDLNAIALGLGGTMSLEHRWPLLGNHDVNVVMMALSSRQPPLAVDWW